MKHLFSPSKELIIKHLRLLVDRLENGRALLHEATDTVTMKQNEFAVVTLSITYSPNEDDINIRLADPSYAVMEKLKTDIERIEL